MVRVTVELVRKKAEHHEMQLAPLEEISLHQEGIERIEYIQNWCPKLQILLLQSNLIPKIENLNKLKELQYLNLAINNIEKIENLERCELLNKLDLTLNFIGELTSINSLKNNYNLRQLFLNGNPCTDYPGYRNYVIAVLPQLETLDNDNIKHSERILALQNFASIEAEIINLQQEYASKRADQKQRLEKEMADKLTLEDEDYDNEEKCKRFWNEKTEHAPETRVQMDKYSRLRNKTHEDKKPLKKERRLFTDCGRPFNVNEPKIPFRLNDESDHEYILELGIYRHLDSSHLEIDVQPFYARVTIKGKIFQICLPEEINITESEAKRSQTTGYLMIVMPKLNKPKPKKFIDYKDDDENSTKEQKPVKQNLVEKNKLEDNKGKRELLEIGPSKNIFDFTDVIYGKKPQTTHQTLAKPIIVKEKIPSVDFVDNPEVPPLL